MLVQHDPYVAVRKGVCFLYVSQNTTDIMSINEALLIRFQTDETIVNKGFVAIFVAVDRQESEENLGGEDDEDSKNL